MKTVSITQAKRKRREPVQHEIVEVTPTTTSGTLRIYAEAHYNAEAAREAARRIREIGAKYKPSKKHGATRVLRDFRDDGK